MAFTPAPPILDHERRGAVADTFEEQSLRPTSLCWPVNHGAEIRRGRKDLCLYILPSWKSVRERSTSLFVGLCWVWGCILEHPVLGSLPLFWSPDGVGRIMRVGGKGRRCVGPGFPSLKRALKGSDGSWFLRERQAKGPEIELLD